MLRHKTTHVQYKIWWIYKTGGNNALISWGFWAILVMMALFYIPEIKEIYSPARGRTETFMKVEDLWIIEVKEATKRGGRKLFTRSTGWKPTMSIIQHNTKYFKFCCSKHCLAQIACFPHNWVLTVGEWLLERRKKALCFWEVKFW